MPPPRKNDTLLLPLVAPVVEVEDEVIVVLLVLPGPEVVLIVDVNVDAPDVLIVEEPIRTTGGLDATRFGSVGIPDDISRATRRALRWRQTNKPRVGCL